ncbi:hypothetical protein CK203_034701 [Vitis vinifera]|uniref:Uncharacterized protein n=1 Tax=Vitis vinifera TaxID=29760 RepID=A0A438HWC7_VITVI|nr:hypothetical protein CK203_034701 [Vitis vinifera]
MVKEVKTVITLRSGKEVDLPTCKLEHDEESETKKEKREEIKGKRKGKSIEKDDYDFNVDEELQRIVIKEEMMKKHMPPLFLQALYGKIIQRKSQLEIAPCEIATSLRNDFAAPWPPLRKFSQLQTTSWHTSAISQPHTLISQLRNGCEISKALKFQFSQPKPHFAGCFAAAKHPFGTRVPFRSRPTPFHSCEMGCENGTQLRKSHLNAKCFRSPIATPCQILHLLRKWLFVAK